VPFLAPARTLIGALNLLEQALRYPPGDPRLLDGSAALTAAVRAVLARANAQLAVTDPGRTVDQVEIQFSQDLALARAVLARSSAAGVLAQPEPEPMEAAQ
jgi:hypothetical protein